MARRPSLLSDPFLDKEQLAFAKQALRRASYRWPARNEAVKVARIARGVYQCRDCNAPVPNKEKELDHVAPVIRTEGPPQTLGEFAGRLLASLAGWQILCPTCHQRKSAAENALRRK